MGCPAEVVTEDSLVFTVATHDPGTGVLTDADAVPTYRVYEDETATPILTGNMAKLDDANTLGFYSESIACTAANGFEDGKTYSIYVSAALSAVAIGYALSFKCVASIPDKVWDEELKGNTHNVPASAGRRLRGIQDFQGYEMGAVWIDTINGTAGTTNFENGTVENPVDSLADALTLAVSVGLTRFEIDSGSSITLAASADGYVFDGPRWTLALGGQSCSGSVFIGADVTGICTGATPPRFHDCSMGVVTLPACRAVRCGIGGDVTLADAGDYFFEACYSEIAGTATPSMDFGAAVGSTNLNMRPYSGGVEVKNMGRVGTDRMSLEGFGQLVLNANCTGGTIAIRGTFTVTDNAAEAVTLSDDARIDTAQIGDAVWDEATAGHVAAGSTADLLADIQAVVAWMQDVAEGDVEIDVSGTPYELVIKVKGTDTERVRKKLYQADGTAVSAVTHVVGKQLESAP